MLVVSLLYNLNFIQYCKNKIKTKTVQETLGLCLTCGLLDRSTCG